MSTRYEGAGAGDVHFTVHMPGTLIGEDIIPDGEIALAFNYDEVFYIQGTPEAVTTLLADGQRLLQNVRRRRERDMERGIKQQQQYTELASTIANQAGAIAEGHFQGQSLRAQVALLKNNINTLEAWTPGEEEDEPSVRTNAHRRTKR